MFVWGKLDMLSCEKERRVFPHVGLEAINVSEHHGRNSLFCLFLARLLQQLRADIWVDIPTTAEHNSQEQKDMASVKALLPEFKNVRDELNERFSPMDWFEGGRRSAIRQYIHRAMHSIIDNIV
jgi:hypothetical protein